MAAAACQLMLPAATTEGAKAQGMVPERGGRLLFSLLSPFCLAWISIMLFIVVLSLSFSFAVVVVGFAGFQLMLFPAASCISFLLWLCK